MYQKFVTEYYNNALKNNLRNWHKFCSRNKF